MFSEYHLALYILTLWTVAALLVAVLHMRRMRTTSNHHNNNHKLACGHITAISPDSFGDLWIGTYHSGLFRYSSTRQRLDFFQINNYSANYIPESKRLIYCIYDDSNRNLWIGLECGLAKYDHQTDLVTFVTYLEAIVYAISEDTSCNLWLATSDGIFVYDYGNNKLDRVPDIYDEHWCLIKLPSGNFGTVCHSMFKVINPDRRELIIEICIGPSYTVASESQKTAWILSEEGAYTIDADDNVTKQDIPVEGKVNAVFCDSQRRLWFGSHAGVSRYDSNRREWRHFGRGGLVPDAPVTAIAQDKIGSMWIGTWGRGLVRTDLNCKMWGRLSCKTAQTCPDY